MTIKIQPLSEQIENWIEKYVPEKDFFFLNSEGLITFEEYLHDVLVIPQAEFFKHSSYNQIQLVNSYQYWKISDEVQYVIVAYPGWITNLPIQKKKELLSMQVKVGRGLIFSLSCFSNANDIPKEHIVEDEFVVLQYDMWRKLPYEMKEHAIMEYAKQWDDWTCYEVPNQAPIHLQKYANTFAAVGGSNCLSATLFAISQQEWIIHEWVHPQTLLQGLKRANYSITHDDLCENDVVVWEDSDGRIQHASYHIGNNLFFNKDGQTFFNPWKIIGWDELKVTWKKYNIKVFRKTEKNDL